VSQPSPRPSRPHPHLPPTLIPTLVAGLTVAGRTTARWLCVLGVLGGLSAVVIHDRTGWPQWRPLEASPAPSAAGPALGAVADLAVAQPAPTADAVVDVVQAREAVPAVLRESRRARASAAARSRVVARQEAARSAIRDPRGIARIMVAERGWSSAVFTCLNLLWNKESRWNYRARNPYSGAYGIPQALPGGKMASAGADWRTNPVTQITWGLGYIADLYGTPCGAWSHSKSHGWY
jgi:murein DD-endopeptidase MepM/ murein hydrolase activator NlpD